jgi:hypothetical protein
VRATHQGTRTAPDDPNWHDYLPVGWPARPDANNSAIGPVRGWAHDFTTHLSAKNV